MDKLEERTRLKSRLRKSLRLLALIAAILLLAVLLYRIPAVQDRLAWRIDAGMTALRTFFSPIGPMPSPALAEPQVIVVTLTPASVPTSPESEATHPVETQTPPPAAPIPTEAPLPDKVELPAPYYELQDWNSCGPAALSMLLHFYDWEGSQKDINAVIKPLRADRNVNIDELASFVNTQTAGLKAEYRVGGDLQLLRRLLAAGFPVIIEETFYLSEDFWFNDDRWSGHYQLITGYEDNDRKFITQDSFISPNRMMNYSELDANWQAFNRAFLLVYPLEKEDALRSVLQDDWDIDLNRQHALEMAQAETKSDPTNAFTWFNLGSNLVYFERYPQAANAYDTARQLGLPQRMMRYQFGPFLAYFHGSRTDDLLALANYALEVTPNSEETLLWKGWALYRLGKTNEAVPLFQEALKAHPGYTDADYALEYIRTN